MKKLGFKRTQDLKKASVDLDEMEFVGSENLNQSKQDQQSCLFK